VGTIRLLLLPLIEKKKNALVLFLSLLVECTTLVHFTEVRLLR
jgi:hypothetical protein